MIPDVSLQGREQSYLRPRNPKVPTQLLNARSFYLTYMSCRTRAIYILMGLQLNYPESQIHVRPMVRLEPVPLSVKPSHPKNQTDNQDASCNHQSTRTL